MTRPWYVRNEAYLKARFPRIVKNIARTGTLSTSAFTLAIAEEFIILSIVTLICVEYGLYSIWSGVLIGFFIHLIYHIVSFLIMGRYVPCILTSVIVSPYSIYALIALNSAGYLAWGDIVIWSVIAIAFIAGNLIFAIIIAERFDMWLGYWQKPRLD